jgi:hypothetical protein
LGPHRSWRGAWRICQSDGHGDFIASCDADDHAHADPHPNGQRHRLPDSNGLAIEDAGDDADDYADAHRHRHDGSWSALRRLACPGRRGRLC